MQQVRRSLLAALLTFPITTMADICPDAPPATKHYVQTFNCPAATISAEGEKYTEDSWDCFTLVPIKSELVSYSSGKNKAQLPPVASLLPATEKDMKDRTWMTSNVQCNRKDKISVRYWGGGNCKVCERQVQYRFAPDGKLEEAKLQ